MYGSTRFVIFVGQGWCNCQLELHNLSSGQGIRQAWRGCGASFMNPTSTWLIGELRQISYEKWTRLAFIRSKSLARLLNWNYLLICGQSLPRRISTQPLLFVFLLQGLCICHYLFSLETALTEMIYKNVILMVLAIPQYQKNLLLLFIHELD